MEVRQAGASDAAAVAELITHFFAVEGFTTPPEVIAERAPIFLTADNTAVFLAISDGEPVGIATVTSTFGFEGGKLADVEDLFVRTAHRGKGVATALLGEAMLWSREHGFESLRVVVTPEDETRKDELIGWYARLGYQDTGRVVLHFGAAGLE